MTIYTNSKEHENPLHGVKPNSRHATLITEAIALGQLYYSRERAVWEMGPYTGRTARGVFAVAGKNAKTIAEQRRELEEDKERIRRAYRKSGSTIPDVLLPGREKQVSEREAALASYHRKQSDV